jgi:hypothetical protein
VTALIGAGATVSLVLLIALPFVFRAIARALPDDAAVMQTWHRPTDRYDEDKAVASKQAAMARDRARRRVESCTPRAPKVRRSSAAVPFTARRSA